MKLAALAVVACALGAAPVCACAEYPSIEKQMKLDDGMTMEQVRALLGDPDSTAQKTCPDRVGQCRWWNYGKSVPSFSVWFRKHKKGGWVVSGWMG